MSQPTASPPQIAMATPIQTLPAPSTNASNGPTDMSDPLVSDVLNEMEKEVQSAKQPSQMMAQYNQASMPSIPTVPTMAFPSYPAKKEWIHTENLKRVTICMLLSFVLFNPSWIFPQLYERYYRLNFLQSYDMIVRVVLFGIFLYILWTYVPYP